MKESPELKNFILAIEQIDPQEALAFYERIWSKNPGTDFIFNAPGAYWRGYDEIMALLKAMGDYLDPSQEPHKNIRAYEEGSVGWANFNTLQKLPGGKTLEWRESFIFHQEEGEWKLVHAHSSLPVPDGEAFNGNETLVRKFIEGYDRNDVTMLDEVLASHFIFHQYPYPDYHLQDLKHHIAENHRSFPDLHNTLEDVISKGDRVVIRVVEEGTHLGEFEGIQPTGNKIKTTWIGIFRIEEGRIVEGWLETNDRYLYDQLGAPTPPLPIS